MSNSNDANQQDEPFATATSTSASGYGWLILIVVVVILFSLMVRSYKNDVTNDVLLTYQEQNIVRVLNIPVTDTIAVKINKAIDKCMLSGYKSSGGLMVGGLYPQIRSLSTSHKATAKEQEQAIKDAELVCTTQLITQATNAVGSKARALIYVLEQQNYAVNPDFKKLAEKNDNDLNKIEISLN